MQRKQLPYVKKELKTFAMIEEILGNRDWRKIVFTIVKTI
jgi:hypothetical protein